MISLALEQKSRNSILISCDSILYQHEKIIVRRPYIKTTFLKLVVKISQPKPRCKILTQKQDILI